MWYQKDWFTGIDYYNLKEKQVHITEMEIKKPVEQRFHEQTEIYYVISGDAELWINGEKFQIQEGSFFCLYMHLFYRIENIRKPLHCVKVSFHIGLFMSLCFEQRKAKESRTCFGRSVGGRKRTAIFGAEYEYLSCDAALCIILSVCDGTEEKRGDTKG